MSNFCIYGIVVNERDMVEIGDTGLEQYWVGTDSKDHVIGRSLDSIGDDETGQEFKDHTVELLYDAGFDPDNCFTITNESYDIE